MKKLLALLLLLSCGSALAADCALDRADLLTRPDREAGPTQVYIHSYINDIVAIRDADQSFAADVFIRVDWIDPRLAHAGEAPCTAAREEIWWPQLQLMNRRSVEQVRDAQPMVSPDGTVSMLMRGFGEFSFRADLSDFPLDSQELNFDLISAYSDKEVDFVYDLERLSLSPELSVANFAVEFTGVEERGEFLAATRREHVRLLIKLRATRLAGFYTWQQLVPLFLVVLMSWIVFWIPREHVASRVGLSATSMLTLIAYRFAMSTVLPPIAYLTRLDAFMIGASVLVFTALATAVAVTYVTDRVDEVRAERVNRVARLVIPLLLVFITWFSFFA